MKITVIGGAGVRTVIFINGLLKRYQKLGITEVVLYDIQAEKLNMIEKLCKYIVEQSGEKLAVTAAYDAVSAIEGADYIVTTLRVGGDHARVLDERLALEEGVIGQETTGVGGWSMAVRTIPVLIEYCKMIEEHAPNAWIFNFTNPSGLVTQALHQAGYHRVLGICDAPSSTKFRMAEKLNIKEENLDVGFFGLNHLSWINSVKTGDRELLHELLKDEKFLNSIQEFQIFDHDLLKVLGFLPNEYLYYYYHREKALDNMLHTDHTRGRVIEDVNKQMFKELRDMDIDKSPSDALQTFLYYMQLRENSYMSVESGSKERPMERKGNLSVPSGMGYAGVMLDCIEGMQSYEGRTVVLSVQNSGSIPGLADDDIVEITCNVSKDGIVPMKVWEVPEDCLLLMRQIKFYEKMTIASIKDKSLDQSIRALMSHPLVSSYSLAKKLVHKYDQAYDGLFKRGKYR